MDALIRRCISMILLAAAGWSFSGTTRPQGFSFDQASGVKNRLITPNGDGKNDRAEFKFINPGVDVTGRVFDLKGGFVADMGVCPDDSLTPPECLEWDGKSSGAAVSGGVYIYVIIAEGKVYSGTVVVIR